MRSQRILIVFIVIGLIVPIVDAQSRAGRRAKKGAAMGAVWGLLLGRDLGDVAAGAAAGAALGGVSGAVDDSYAKKDQKRYEQQRAQAEAEARARALDEERRRLEEERLALEERERALAAQEVQSGGGGDPTTEDEWIEVIGIDNWNGLLALGECQHQRALLLAQAGATIDNAEYRLASKWLEALVAVDLKDSKGAEKLYPALVELDSEVDTVQQASIEADKAILEIRDLRQEEGVVCQR